MFRKDQKRAKTLAKLIVAGRSKKGLSQEQLAVSVKVSTETIRKIEQCKTSSPGFFVIADISKTLKINISRLLQG